MPCRWLLTTVALIFSAALATAQVRISEIHYDNTGADTGEADRDLGARGHRSHRLAASFSTTAAAAPRTTR